MSSYVLELSISGSNDHWRRNLHRNRGSREVLYLISLSGYLYNKLENYFELQQIMFLHLMRVFTTKISSYCSSKKAARIRLPKDSTRKKIHLQQLTW